MNECCKDPKNLESYDEPTAPADENLVVTKCAVCGCRHFELTVDPLKLDFTGGSLA